jgi:hypothetical protein
MADAAVAITDQRRRKKEFPTALTLPSFLCIFLATNHAQGKTHSRAPTGGATNNNA